VLKVATREFMLHCYQSVLGMHLAETASVDALGSERYRLKFADERAQSVCLELLYSPGTRTQTRSRIVNGFGSGPTRR